MDVDKIVLLFTSKRKLSELSDNRTIFLSGEDCYNKPVRRSTDEIKAKYGHKRTGVRFLEHA